MLSLAPLKLMSYYVVGLGVSGKSTVSALVNAGARVFAYNDGFQKAPDFLDESVRYAKPHEVPWSELDALVLSPGIPHLYPFPHSAATLAREYDVPIICDVDLLADCYPENVYIGVTGTNGKSTTTSLLHHLLPSAKCAGNNGVPVCDLGDIVENDVIILELSSYQLERTPHLECDIAVFLNISPDHIDRHGSMEGYIEAKSSILLPKGVAQIIVIGIDTPETKAIYENLLLDTAKMVIPISVEKVLDKGISIVQGIVFDDGTEIMTLKADLPLSGAHNHQNIAACYGVMKVIGVPFNFKALETFTSLPHRLETIYTREGLTIINDSKSTNIYSTKTALDACKDSDIVLILGGIPKETGLEGLELYRDNITHCFLYGDAQDDFAHFLKAHGIPFTKCSHFEAVVEKSLTHCLLRDKSATAEKDTVLLLSPACASFDYFLNYEERGNAFKDQIQQLLKQNKID